MSRPRLGVHAGSEGSSRRHSFDLDDRDIHGLEKALFNDARRNTAPDLQRIPALSSSVSTQRLVSAEQHLETLPEGYPAYPEYENDAAVDDFSAPSARKSHGSSSSSARQRYSDPGAAALPRNFHEIFEQMGDAASVGHTSFCPSVDSTLKFWEIQERAVMSERTVEKRNRPPRVCTYRDYLRHKEKVEQTPPHPRTAALPWQELQRSPQPMTNPLSDANLERMRRFPVTADLLQRIQDFQQAVESMTRIPASTGMHSDESRDDPLDQRLGRAAGARAEVIVK